MYNVPSIDNVCLSTAQGDYAGNLKTVSCEKPGPPQARCSTNWWDL